MTNSSDLHNRFVEAYLKIAQNNQSLADLYVSEYWNGETREWDWWRIGPGGVAEIEKDSIYQTNLD